MTKRSGWRKAGLIAGAGCASIVGVLVVGLIIAIALARSTVARLGDTTPTRVERTIPLVGAAVSVPAERVPGTPLREAPLRVTLDLEEGSFTIRPGPPGEQVEVSGTYAMALYELTEDHQTDDTGRTRSATIRFRSKAPAWARMLSGIGGGPSGSQPELTVLIPGGAPMDLSLRLSMGESRIDLGGLTLRDLDLDVSMGEHRLDFRSPVVEGIRRVRINASMGNVSVDNLGNARAQTVDTSGSMGNLTADLGGEWEPGSAAQLTFAQSMGELKLNVPTDVHLETDLRSSEDQTDNRRPEVPEPTIPTRRWLRCACRHRWAELRSFDTHVAGSSW